MNLRKPVVVEAGDALTECIAEFAVAQNANLSSEPYLSLNNAIGAFIKSVGAEIERLDSEIEHLKARS